MAHIESATVSYSEFTSDTMTNAFEIHAQAKAVWALLEDVQGKYPEIEPDLTPVSFALMAIERSATRLAENVSDTEFKYIPATTKEAA